MGVEVRSEDLGLGRWGGGAELGGMAMAEPRRTRPLILGQPFFTVGWAEVGFKF